MFGKSSKTLQEALDDYLAFLEIDRSENTRKMYTRVLSQLIEALGPNHKLDAITPADLNRAMPVVLGKGLSEATKNKHKRIVNTWFNRLVAEGYLERSPVHFKIPPVRHAPTDISRAIPDEDIQAMLDACLNTRDRALLVLLRDTAFRFSGAWNLRMEDINPENSTLASQDLKQTEPHTVFMSDAVREALNDWFARRAGLVAQLAKDHGFVFTRLDTGERVSYWGLNNAVRRIGARAGVERFNPHSFRHAWGVWAARNGVPVTEAQAQFGHSSAQVTWDFYYKSPPENLRRTVNRRANRKREDDGANGDGREGRG